MNKFIKYKEIDGIKVRFNKPTNVRRKKFLPVFKLKDWNEEFDEKLFNEIVKIYNKEKDDFSNYASYKYLEKLGLGKVFKCLKAYYIKYPLNIRFNVDRSGLNVYFKLINKIK